MMSKIFQLLGPKGLVLVFLFLALTTFCLQNIETVSVQFLFWNIVAVPKLYLILISALAGVMIGFILGWQIAHIGRKSNSNQERVE